MNTAPFGRRLLEVSASERHGAYTVLSVADPGASDPEPGQFAMLAAAERWGGGGQDRPFLPRAFSIMRRRDGASHYLLEDVGPGTRRLCELRAGEDIWVTGPLGRGFGLPAPGQRPILVGGGVGIAPLAILQDALDGSVDGVNPVVGDGPVDGVNPVVGDGPVVLLGFRDGARAQGAALLNGAQLATDDGSYGHNGLVTELLVDELDEAARAGVEPIVYSCGPAPMLEAVRALCAERAVPAQLALEAGMACGYGACFGCVVPRRDGSYLRVCLDGPVVDAAELSHVDAHAGAPA
ncbi:MAG TPA: hypothetical protein VH025_07400 [Solirubrobacteraceae bacterium]|nr:hypothetical protein [Solirubrobacteraceae bacterium]